MASKLFVGNLDFRTTGEELSALFSQVGAIREVFLPLDRETRRPRGFAFVEYENEEDAATAIERLNGHELGGRPLRVNAAEDRPRGGGGAPSGFGGGRPSFGGGGGGGGFGPDAPPRGFGGGKPKGSRRNLRAKKRGF